jgi:hypothetical protein
MDNIEVESEVLWRSVAGIHSLAQSLDVFLQTSEIGRGGSQSRQRGGSRFDDQTNLKQFRSHALSVIEGALGDEQI